MINSNQVNVMEKTDDNSKQPGWPEIIIMIIGYVVILFVIAPIIKKFIEEGTVLYGISFAALSGVAGLGAFFAAYLLRHRHGTSFGLRKTNGRWLLAGLGFGVGAFLFGRLVAIVMFYIGFTGFNTQESYETAATGGTLALIVQLLMIAVLTPLGEEFAFRGVLTNALQKYGPWISILSSAFVFAMFHGLNEIWPAAFITGLATGYLFYRTKSVWPGVIVHAVHNGLATILIPIAAKYFM